MGVEGVVRKYLEVLCEQYNELESKIRNIAKQGICGTGYFTELYV